MKTKELKQEINAARRHRMARAAFGSIIRRYVKELAWMTRDERLRWLQDMEQPSSYDTEILKEISIMKYEKEFIND